MRHPAPSTTHHACGQTARRLLPLLFLGLLCGITPKPASAGSILPAIEAARRAPDARSWDVGKHYVKVGDNLWMAVKGKRERRQVRYSRLWSTWSADQRRVATELGFPVHRLLELDSGRESETWSYPEHHVRVVFDGTGRLLGRHAG